MDTQKYYIIVGYAKQGDLMILEPRSETPEIVRCTKDYVDSGRPIRIQTGSVWKLRSGGLLKVKKVESRSLGLPFPHRTGNDLINGFLYREDQRIPYSWTAIHFINEVYHV